MLKTHTRSQTDCKFLGLDLGDVLGFEFLASFLAVGHRFVLEDF